MEPTADQRIAFMQRLDSVTMKIRSFVGTAIAFRHEGIQIDNMTDFVLGMVYQDFFEKCLKYNLMYVKAHSETTKDVDIMDLSRIVIDVFLTEAESVKALIEKELPKN